MKKATEVAKYILQESGKNLSNLELQKTLYFAELAFQKEHGKQLIEDGFEAWQYGPVAREVYYEYRNYGASPIKKPGSSVDLGLSRDEERTIRESIASSNKKTYWQLVEESHKAGGAWKEAYRDGEKNIIKQDDISKEAKTLHDKAK